MKLRQERIENSDVHYDSNSSRQHSTIYTKDEEAEFFPRKYSGLPNKRTGTLINFQKKCTRYALIRCYFATMDLISVPKF